MGGTQLNILAKNNYVLCMLLDMITEIKYAKYLKTINIIRNMEDSFCNETTPYDCPEPQITSQEIDYTEAPKDIKTHMNIMGVIKPETKLKVFEFFKEHLDLDEEDYATMFHPKSYISSAATIGHGVTVGPLTSVAPYAELGNMVSVNRNVSIGHHTAIGDYSTINPGVNIAGCCKIGKNVFIGMGVNICDGIEIGDGTVIGAGSLVNKSVQGASTAWGFPAKTLKKENWNSRQIPKQF